MKRDETGLISFLRCYQSLIAWVICFCLVAMTFFQLHLPGKLWGFFLVLGVFAELYFMGKNRDAYPLPDRFRGWVIAAAVLCGVFAFFSVIFAFVELFPTGSPDILDGAYITRGKGFVRGTVRYITQQEYHRLMCVEQRVIAGHMLFFYALLMCGSLQKKKRLSNAEEKGD